MFEELKEKMSKIENDNNNYIKSQTTKAKDELTKMKRNIDNIIFCRLQKELKKNNQMLLKNEINFSEEILLMRALTQLNIIPIILDNDSINSKEDNEEYEQYLFFLLSKNKAKNLINKDEPLQFWKSFLKFKDLKSK